MANTKHPYKYFVILFAAAGLAVGMMFNAVAEPQSLRQPVSLATNVVDTQVTPAGCDCTCPKDSCCCSQSVCCPKVVEKEIKKHCWKVTPELVCIPKFRWPWQQSSAKSPSCGDGCDGGCQSCQPSCGRVRCINVLEKHEYTCKQCGYEWSIKRVCSSNGSCDSAAGCCPDCGCK